MFQTLQNTVSIDLTLVPDGPILVRAQSVGIDPGIADMEFHRTHRNGKSTVFLAGSGLKGVLRSHCERLLRSSSPDGFACDPTQRNERCGDLGDPQPRRPHAGQCGACFTFGSLGLAGRFRISDAYPKEGLEVETNRTEVRTGVGIDRRSQAAATKQGVLYDSEVVVGGGFQTRISGENFSLWQLGLVLAALQDLDSGLVRIGGAKARGMGGVHVRECSVELGFLNKSDEITGAKQMQNDRWRYGLPENDNIPVPEGGQASHRGVFRTLQYKGETAVEALASALTKGPLQTYLGERI